MRWGMLARVSAVIAKLLVLAGCEDMVKVTDVYRLPLYGKSTVLQAAAQGRLVAEVYGSPFRSEVDPLAVIQTLTLPGGFSPNRIVPYSGPTDDIDAVSGLIRIVLVFNANRLGPGRDNACRNPTRLGPGSARGDRTRVAANLCAGHESISSLVAEAPTPDGFSDRRYAELMNQVMVNLLPNRN